MITEATGNLLEADVDALVNTVNTVGVMGKGLALQFKRAFPEMFKAYAAAAKRGEITLGTMDVWSMDRLDGPRFVINFPTKGHWRASSKLRDIEIGLDDLVRVVQKHEIRSITIPPLGCGNGGLDWGDVEPVIRAKLKAIPDVEVQLFPPTRAPAASAMKSVRQDPTMTPARAALIETLGRYAEFAVGGASPIEVQKLMYFLQAMGEPLRLRFARGLYGPYADDLRYALEGVEGHYLTGCGDGSQTVAAAESLQLLPGARELAEQLLSGRPESQRRIQLVLELVEGYESPYSLELLATVHWIAAQDPRIAADPDRIAEVVSDWSPRKHRLFTPDHVMKAWRTLEQRGLIPLPA